MQLIDIENENSNIFIQILDFIKIGEIFLLLYESYNEKYDESEHSEDGDGVVLAAISYAAGYNRPRGPSINREQQKESWMEGYANWTEDRFKVRIRVTRDTFEYILQEIRQDITKTPTKTPTNYKKLI